MGRIMSDNLAVDDVKEQIEQQIKIIPDQKISGINTRLIFPYPLIVCTVMPKCRIAAGTLGVGVHSEVSVS